MIKKIELLNLMQLMYDDKVVFNEQLVREDSFDAVDINEAEKITIKQKINYILNESREEIINSFDQKLIKFLSLISNDSNVIDNIVNKYYPLIINEYHNNLVYAPSFEENLVEIKKNNGIILEEMLYVASVRDNSATLEAFSLNLNNFYSFIRNEVEDLKKVKIEEMLTKNNYSSLEEFEGYFLELKEMSVRRDFQGWLLRNQDSIQEYEYSIYSLINSNSSFYKNLKTLSKISTDMIQYESIIFKFNKITIDEILSSFDSMSKIYMDSDESNFAYNYKNTQDDSYAKFYIKNILEQVFNTSLTVEGVNIFIKNELFDKDESYNNGILSRLYQFAYDKLSKAFNNDVINKYNLFLEKYNININQEIRNKNEEDIVLQINNVFSEEYIKDIINKVFTLTDEEFIIEMYKALDNRSKHSNKIDIKQVIKEVDKKLSLYPNIIDLSAPLIIPTLNNIISKYSHNAFIIQGNQNNIFFNSTIKESLINNIKKNDDISKNIYKDLDNPENKGNSVIDIRKVLSKDAIRSLFLRNAVNEEIYSGNAQSYYSYKQCLDEINKRIFNLKTFILNTRKMPFSRYSSLEKIDESKIESFFSNLKKILESQLNQEDAYLRGKSDSRGILDLIENNGIKIKELPITIDLNDIKSNDPEYMGKSNIEKLNYLISKDTYNNDLINIIKYPEISSINYQESFPIKLLNLMEKGLMSLYFEMFPDEAIKFFSLRNINDILSNTRQIINTVNSKKTNATLRIANSYERRAGEDSFIRLDDGSFASAYIMNYIISSINKQGEAPISVKSEILSRPEYYDISSENLDELINKIAAYKLRNKRSENIVYIDEVSKTLKQIEDDGIDNIFCSMFSFLNKIFKDEDLGTKKDRIEKFTTIQRLLHNTGGIKSQIVIGSRYFKKFFNKSLADMVETLMTVNLKDEFHEKINFIENLKESREKFPNFIPESYIDDKLIFILNNIDIKNSNDLDVILDKIYDQNLSENVRRLKFVIGSISDINNVVQWLPHTKPKIKEVFEPNFSTGNFRFRVLGDLDPYHFRVGVDTACCQAIGLAGGNAAIDSFINPTAGVVLLEVLDEKGWNLAAQSYFHYAEVNNKKAIILDNIEASARMMHTYDANFYNTAYAILGRYLNEKGFDIVGCGIAHNKGINNSLFGKSSLKKDPRYMEVSKHKLEPYQDFRYDYFINLLDPKFSFNMPNDISNIKSEINKKALSILAYVFKKSGNKNAERLAILSKTLINSGFNKEASEISKLVIVSL